MNETTADTQNIRPGPGSRRTSREYEQAGGYQGLRKALQDDARRRCRTRSSRPTCAAAAGRASPRARSGASCRWAPTPAGPKYFVVNADEMEPGTMKDRLLHGRRPAPAHRGRHRRAPTPSRPTWPTSSSAGSTACRPRGSRKAIAEAYAARLPRQEHPAARGYSLELHLHTSAPAGTCAARRPACSTPWRAGAPSPRSKPPYPQTCGLWGKPTVVNNVETVCCVPHIVNDGPSGSASLSRTADGGTKIYGVSGRVKRPGPVGAADGHAAARDPRRARRRHAATGYALPRPPARRGLHQLPARGAPRRADGLRLGLEKAGSRLGTGTMIVLDDRTCPVGMMLQPGAVLRPRVVRLVHALPRGPAVGGPHAGGHRGGPRRGGRPGDPPARTHVLLVAGPHVLRPGARGGRAAAQARCKYFRDDFERHIREQRCPVEIAVPTIYIDNQPYEVDAEGKNLLEVCLSLGFDLPYFCWHPAMHSVGACRQCAVKQFKDDDDTRGRIVMACMTPVDATACGSPSTTPRPSPSAPRSSSG